MITPGNVGKPFTIYKTAEFTGTAYSKAIVLNNITKYFMVTGFVPFIENIFIDDEFLAATATNLPMLHKTDFDDHQYVTQPKTDIP